MAAAPVGQPYLRDSVCSECPLVPPCSEGPRGHGQGASNPEPASNSPRCGLWKAARGPGSCERTWVLREDLGLPATSPRMNPRPPMPACPHMETQSSARDCHTGHGHRHGV